MNEYYKSHRRPLHDYIFGYFHAAAALLQPIAPLANALMRMDWSRWMISETLGLTRKRDLPTFSRRPNLKRDLHSNKKIIFLSDVFSEYIEPQVAESAVDLLNAFGYEVLVLPVIGAGASFLSKGFIEAAKRHAEKVLAEIQRLDGGAGLSVVGCEPPEVYCLKHEYLSLLPQRREEIESISQRVWMMEEFILRVAKEEGIPDSFAVMNKDRLILHPHCHQRAESLSADAVSTGAAASAELLRMFGFDVTLTDAACCGMAGTFGFDADHYDLAMQVGELKLFKDLRGLRDAKVAATGAACRMHIEHGAEIQSQHPLVLISMQLKKEAL